MKADQVVIAKLTILKILFQLRPSLICHWLGHWQVKLWRESRHSTPKEMPQLQNSQRKAPHQWRSIHSFQRAFNALLFWQRDMMTYKGHGVPTQHLPDSPQGPQRGQSLCLGSHQNTAQMSNLFWWVSHFYSLTTSKLLLWARKVALYYPYQLGLIHLMDKQDMVTDVFSSQYVHTGFCDLYPQNYFLRAGEFCPWLMLPQRLLLFCPWEVVTFIRSFNIVKGKKPKQNTKTRESFRNTNYLKVWFFLQLYQLANKSIMSLYKPYLIYKQTWKD